MFTGARTTFFGAPTYSQVATFEYVGAPLLAFSSIGWTAVFCILLLPLLAQWHFSWLLYYVAFGQIFSSLTENLHDRILSNKEVREAIP